MFSLFVCEGCFWIVFAWSDYQCKSRVLVTVQSNNYGAFDFQVFSFVNNFKEDLFYFYDIYGIVLFEMSNCFLCVNVECWFWPLLFVCCTALSTAFTPHKSIKHESKCDHPYIIVKDERIYHMEQSEWDIRIKIKCWRHRYL